MSPWPALLVLACAPTPSPPPPLAVGGWIVEERADEIRVAWRGGLPAVVLSADSDGWWRLERAETVFSTGDREPDAPEPATSAAPAVEPLTLSLSGGGGATSVELSAAGVRVSLPDGGRLEMAPSEPTIRFTTWAGERWTLP